MANYINKNILCQAYIHVEPDEITEELLENLQNHLESFVKTRAEFFLYPNPEINIELKEGSIKVYATILGTVTTLFAGIANYPDFREGAILLYEDTKRLSDYITTESIFTTKARHNQVIRIEARTGVVGSLRKIVGELDALKSMNGKEYANTHSDKIIDIKDQTLKLIDNLNSIDDVSLVKEGLLSIVTELPNLPLPPNKKTNSDEAILLYQRELEAMKAVLRNA